VRAVILKLVLIFVTLLLEECYVKIVYDHARSEVLTEVIMNNFIFWGAWNSVV
jgi:hypothetical protein